MESSLLHSAVGNPYNFEVVNGAGEIGTGGKITGLLILPGNQGTAALEVTSRSSTWVLYGTSAQDWKFVNYNVGVGALDRTLQNLFDAFSADDHGITMMKQSQNYGNFDAARLTYNIQPFITSLVGQSYLLGPESFQQPVPGLLRERVRDLHHRHPQGIVGHGVVLFPDPVICSFDGENSNGRTVHVFGTSTGYVMQNDSGTSFDGAQINAYLNTNINTAKSPGFASGFVAAFLSYKVATTWRCRLDMRSSGPASKSCPTHLKKGRCLSPPCRSGTPSPGTASIGTGAPMTWCRWNSKAPVRTCK